MTAIEQLWFVIGIGGFLLFLENIFTFLAISIVKRFPPKRIPKDELQIIIKIIVGVAIFILALIYLFNLPST